MVYAAGCGRSAPLAYGRHHAAGDGPGHPRAAARRGAFARRGAETNRAELERRAIAYDDPGCPPDSFGPNEPGTSGGEPTRAAVTAAETTVRTVATAEHPGLQQHPTRTPGPAGCSAD
jgi:hypothetical protein